MRRVTGRWFARWLWSRQLREREIIDVLATLYWPVDMQLACANTTVASRCSLSDRKFVNIAALQNIAILCGIFRPHRNTTYVRVDAAHCYRRSIACGGGGLSIGLSRSWALQKRLSRSRCRLGCWLGWAQEIIIRWVHIGAAWQIRLNRTCAAAMRSFCQITSTTCWVLQ